MFIRVAILSDTHGVVDERIAALVRDCDYAVHAGDILGAAVLAALQPRRAVIAVRGNNDVPFKWPPAEHAVLRTLPQDARLELPGGILAVTHGDRIYELSDRHGRLRRLYPEARAIVYGHSHHLSLDQAVTPWILNPGAAGRTRTHGGPSCLILTATPETWEVQVRRFELVARSKRKTTV